MASNYKDDMSVQILIEEIIRIQKNKKEAGSSTVPSRYSRTLKRPDRKVQYKRRSVNVAEEIILMNRPPDDRVAKAEEVKIRIIEYMQKQVAEQIGAGVNHPYASGKFDIAYSKGGPTYIAQLNFYPKLKDSDGFADKPEVVDRGKSEIDALDSMCALLHFVDPTRIEYRNKKW
ncbi:uncharacterized protein M421DRAFT_411008 [Didymella exigua CBS 183.55]|uniref:Uncharacterized protein n=1 Tax=Didymella exigua CBS 183.55 TaxID=1150837 RepID=A0A6A5S009_9PLEO|nr:uncharacterized protein M421DRAFT_411008 [Didymella exigua CBS 183.55]KAF1930847.1 hypothetical protein M421DRAFT_411008 [Didymella exigua CBS 183.55]